MRELLKDFTVLYVEDDPDTNEVITSILKSRFKEVYSAFNGKEGLEAYEEKHPDIVLSDIQMPLMNGIEMSAAIKEINPHQEIALFTAFNEPEHLKKAVNLGISKYVLKPIDEEQFFGALVSMAKVLQADRDLKTNEHLLAMKSKNVAVGEVLGYIAHQWRQPLSTVSALLMKFHVDLELDKPISQAYQKEFIQGIEENILYLSNTINDFRNFFYTNETRIQAFELAGLLKNIMALTKDMFIDQQIKVIFDIQKGIKVVQDKNSLLHTVLNIMNNAKDAFVQNSIEPKERYLFIHAEKDKEGFLNMRIKDSAGGIDETIIDKVFQPYMTTKFQNQGTGIGLYMCFQIIHKHFKGDISVQNSRYEYDGKQLRGAEFKIRFQDAHTDAEKVD